MRALLRLLWAFVLSAAVAGAASLELAVLTAAREEYIVVLTALAIFLLLATLTYAVGAILLNRKSALRLLTFGLALLVTAAVAGAFALTRQSLTASDAILLGSFAASALLGLGAQWLVVRRLFV